MALSREELIRQIYRDQLGRTEVDTPGLNYWMNSQLPDERLSGAIGFAATQPTVDESYRSAGASPAAAYMQDPSYNLYMRQMGFNESDIQSTLAAAKDRINRNLGIGAPMYDRQRDRGVRNVGESFASRGMYRSGRRLQDQMDLVSNIDYNQARENYSARDRQAQLETQAAQQIAAGRRQLGEQQLNTGQRLTQGSLG